MGADRTGTWSADPRIQGMHDLRRQGATLKQIGDAYGLTRERVRQILDLNGAATSRDAADARQERKDKDEATARAGVLLHLLANPGHTCEQVAAATGQPVERITSLARHAGALALLGDAFAGGMRGSARVFTDADLLTWVRRAAGEVNRPYLSTIAYRRWRTTKTGAPSVALISQRFTSWVAACTAAGVIPGEPRRAAYTRAFSDQELVGAVATFLTSSPPSSSAGNYDRWRAEQDTALPSVSLIRKRTGSWNTARTLALETMTGASA